MEITRNGTQPSVKGPDEWFTGDVRIDSQFQRSEPSRLTGAIVTFEPGARTALAHPSAGTDTDRDFRDRLDPMRGRKPCRNPCRRRDLVSAWTQALARRHSHDGDDAHRHSGSTGRQECHLDGEGDGRGISCR